MDSSSELRIPAKRHVFVIHFIELWTKRYKTLNSHEYFKHYAGVVAVIGNIYRNPNSCQENDSELCDLIHLISNRFSKFIIVGDYRQDCHVAANCRYCFYSQAKNQVFRPAGATRCTDSGQTLQNWREPGSAWLCKISRQSMQRGGNAAPKISKISTFW